MFDVSWKPKNYTEKIKKEPSFGGYHHYSISNYEDVDGFTEWLRYQGATDIKVDKHIPYTISSVEEARKNRGLKTTETDKRNIKLVKKIACECQPGNIPYSLSFINEIKCDLTKPVLICLGGDYFPLEHVYVLDEEDLDEEDKDLAGCIVFDIE